MVGSDIRLEFQYYYMLSFYLIGLKSGSEAEESVILMDSPILQVSINSRDRRIINEGESGEIFG